MNIRKILVLIILLLLTLCDAQLIKAEVYEWTKNSGAYFDEQYWLPRTWAWEVALPDWLVKSYYSPSPGEATGEDVAEIVSGIAHLRADYDMYSYVICAGVTQGWAWGENTKPSGIYDPPPLQITPSITRLWLETYISWMDYWAANPYPWVFDEAGVLSNVWFRVQDVFKYYDGWYTYYPETVLGIDFYYAVAGDAPYDGYFRDDLPDCMVYTKYYLGSGERTCDILNALRDAVFAAQEQENIYFSIWKCKLMQVEDVVEEHMGYSEAYFSYLRVFYEVDPSLPSTAGLHVQVWTGSNWKDSCNLMLHSDRDIIDVSKVMELMTHREYRKLVLRTLVQENHTLLIDKITVIAVNESNIGFAFQLSEAIHSIQGDVVNQIIKSDDNYVELRRGDLLKLTLKSSKLLTGNWKIFIIVEGKKKP